MIAVENNPILEQIEDRAKYIQDLVHEYPRFLKKWSEETDKSFQEIASEYAEGDPDVFYGTYSSFLPAFEEDDCRRDIFYKAMVLMVYSYYEGIIEFLVRKTKSDDLVELICKVNNIELSDEAKKAKEHIKNSIRHLRNHLAHNNLMSSKQIEYIKTISEKWPEIRFSDDDITINGSDFILKCLEEEEFVLKEICEKLGFKHKRTNVSKQK